MSLEDLAAKFDVIKKQMMDEATTAIHAEFKTVFDKHPELTVIKWTQYTPYFNDGDECTFSVNDFTVSNAPDPENVSAWGEYEGDEAEDKVFAEQLYGNRAQKYSGVKTIQDFAMSDIGEDVFRNAFGDHSIVTVTREGIDVEDYEHD